MDYPDVHPVEIDGARIRLREVSTDDAHASMQWASDPEFYRHLAVAPVTTEAQEVAFFERLRANAKTRPRRQYDLGVVWRETNELVGLVRITISAPEHRAGDIGYGFRRDRWGHGIATDAAALLLDFGFGTLQLHRIYAYHHPGNEASGRVMQKLGMTYEGRLRENILRHDGTWRDSVVYGILATEYERR